jgi:Flp pilus assembly protein TadD
MTSNDIAAHVQAARAAQQRGDMGAAVRHYENALALQPGSPQILNSLGMIALATPDFALAARHFSEAIKSDSLSPVLLNAAWAMTPRNARRCCASLISTSQI